MATLYTFPLRVITLHITTCYNNRVIEVGRWAVSAGRTRWVFDSHGRFRASSWCCASGRVTLLSVETSLCTEDAENLTARARDHFSSIANVSLHLIARHNVRQKRVVQVAGKRRNGRNTYVLTVSAVRDRAMQSKSVAEGWFLRYREVHFSERFRGGGAARAQGLGEIDPRGILCIRRNVYMQN